jgi:ADP-heptose:LPS heptosyltransferase
MNPGTLLPQLPPGARILLIRLRSIGDIVLLTPAVRKVKAWRPDLRLSLMIEPRFHDLVEDNPDIDEVLDPGDQLLRQWASVRSLRQRQFAVCVNLHGGPTSRRFTRWSAAAVKVGFHHFRSRRLYDLLVPDAREILGQACVHTVELQAAAFFWLGLPRTPLPRARLLVNPRHADWWGDLRQRLGIAKCGYAVIQPTAVYATKRWAADEFARLGSHLLRECGLMPLFACGPGESGTLDAVERVSHEKILRLEPATLGQYAAVLEQARIFVGNDSGPAHMAAALGRPTVVIFGSSSSSIWGPWPPDGSGRIVQNPYSCNPCPGDRCYRFDRPECIRSITFEQVRSAVTAMLG